MLLKMRTAKNRRTCAVDRPSKRRRTTTTTKCDLFDQLPDDLVLDILCRISSSAVHVSDLVKVFLTCKRLFFLGHSRMVLSKASRRIFAIRLKNWCDSAHRFLKLCADSGNAEACFVLGMIRFYCLENRASGASLMAKAALNSHAPALYSLGIIQFNGSGRAKSEKDIRAGIALCARAAHLGHVPAIREVGYCLQDGYGVRRNFAAGRRFLVQADAREVAAAVVASGGTLLPSNVRCNSEDHRSHLRHVIGSIHEYLWNLPAPKGHPANRFLVEWFGSRLGSEMKLCSLANCGRPETRVDEFRRCSVCGSVNYCSRACQAVDWRLGHRDTCLRFVPPPAEHPDPDPNPDPEPVRGR